MTELLADWSSQNSTKELINEFVKYGNSHIYPIIYGPSAEFVSSLPLLKRKFWPYCGSAEKKRPKRELEPG